MADLKRTASDVLFKKATYKSDGRDRISPDAADASQRQIDTTKSEGEWKVVIGRKHKDKGASTAKNRLKETSKSVSNRNSAQ